jgi:hypothetical protein
MEHEVQPMPEQSAAPAPVEGSSFTERISRRFRGLDAESIPIPARQTALRESFRKKPE